MVTELQIHGKTLKHGVPEDGSAGTNMFPGSDNLGLSPRVHREAGENLLPKVAL